MRMYIHVLFCGGSGSHPNQHIYYSKHAGMAQQPVLEPPTPVDPTMVKKYQAESKRKLTSFFARVTPEQASAAAAAALAPVQQQDKDGKKDSKKKRQKK